MPEADIGAITKRFSSTAWAEPDGVRYAARVSVWSRWLVTGFQFAYRPGFWYYDHSEFVFLYVPLVTVSGLVHYRLLGNRSVTWRWLLVLSAMDLVLITASITLQDGFEGLLFLAYCPVLAPFVLVFLSL